MANCTNCGSELASGARMCGVCSHPVSPEVPPAPPAPPDAPTTAQWPETTPGQWQQAPSQFPGPPTFVRKTDGGAISALVLGILGIVLSWSFIPPIIMSIIAIVIGRQSERRIKESGGALEGQGMAKAGWILGWIGIGIVGLFVLVWILFFGAMMGLIEPQVVPR